MTPQDFIAKWKRANLSERSAARQHFLDLCELLGQPKPAAADPDGAWYTFERGVHKTGGGEGWADVWMKGHFAWEYKRKRRNLLEAYRQLLLYREDLENPPLLVVSDLDRFEIHTNFTAKPTVVFAFSLDELAEPKNLDVSASFSPNLTPWNRARRPRRSRRTWPSASPAWPTACAPAACRPKRPPTSS
ncbi:MAG TPA: type IIL restriction-modification enzyme MmeI [Gemmataceae bacterium]|jgi:hypothetical protein|nr:type IIL restriction-modification enzyme MmeI [Gemmataceae bacterium]